MTMKIDFQQGAKTGSWTWDLPLQMEAAKHIKFIQRFTHELATDNSKGNRAKWFGGNTTRVVNMLTNIDHYLNDRCARIICLSWPGDGTYGSVWYNPTRFDFEDDEEWSKKMWGSDYYQEKTSDFQASGGYIRVATGLQIKLWGSYLKPTVHSGRDGLDEQDTIRINTLFHEMTHRILATSDVTLPSGYKCYGYEKCIQLATTNADSATQNADNWGYFMADYYKHGGSFH